MAKLPDERPPTMGDAWGGGPCSSGPALVSLPHPSPKFSSCTVEELRKCDGRLLPRNAATMCIVAHLYGCSV
jgi:hypothetical protein